VPCQPGLTCTLVPGSSLRTPVAGTVVASPVVARTVLRGRLVQGRLLRGQALRGQVLRGRVLRGQVLRARLLPAGLLRAGLVAGGVMPLRLGATWLLCLLGGLPPAAADPTSYSCSFAAGTAHAYDKGQFVAEKPAPLSFSIGAIDGAAQSAEVRTERGTGSLRLVQAVNATHFLEVVTEGYLNVTTV